MTEVGPELSIDHLVYDEGDAVGPVIRALIAGFDRIGGPRRIAS